MEKNSPSVPQCLQLMEEHAMLPNIRDHSLVVARVSETVISKIADHSGRENVPDRELVVAGALLHDIAKTQCLNTSRDHALAGSDICEQLDLPEIAEIVREHVRLSCFAGERYRKGIFRAKEIIYYSDKRVVHDKIVSLVERLEYILERYGNNDPVRHSIIRRNFSQCRDLEVWLCRAAGCSPSELLQEISDPPCFAER